MIYSFQSHEMRKSRRTKTPFNSDFGKMDPDSLKTFSDYSDFDEKFVRMLVESGITSPALA